MKPQDLADSLDKQNEAKQAEADKQAQLNVVSESGDKVANAVSKGSQDTVKALGSVKGEVKVMNPDLAKTNDIQSVIDQLKEVQLAQLMGNKPDAPVVNVNLADLGAKIASLADQISNVVTELKNDSKQDAALGTKLDKLFSGFVKQVGESFKAPITELKNSVDNLNTTPVVNVPAPNVTVPKLDFQPILDHLQRVETAVKESEAPDTVVDLSSVTAGLKNVQDAITALRFPVPNYVLPFRNQAGKADQVQLASDGSLPISGTVTAGATAAPSAIVAFRTTVTTAGSRVQLGTNTVIAGILEAPSTNTGLIYVGGANVSSTVFGAELQPGQSTGIAIDNTNKIYIDASVNGDKCAFLGS